MHASPLLDLARERGARLGPRPEAPGCETALDFGDPARERRAALEACALLDATDRATLEARGADARDFLHRILANDVRALRPGAGQRDLLLTPKGRVRFDLFVEQTDDGLVLSCAAGTEEALCAAIDGYLFNEDATLDLAGERHAPLELVGPDARALAERVLGAEIELAERAHAVVAEDVRVTRLALAGRPGLRLDPPPERVGSLWTELVEAGAAPAGTRARDVLRVETGSVLQGVDLNEDVYPQEARLEDAFSLAKGCFVGQEVVAKLDTYGGLNRRLVAVRLDGDVPATGTRLLAPEGERELGRVTTAVRSPAVGAPLALAFVKVEHGTPGTRLVRADDGTAAEVVPFPLAPRAERSPDA